MSGCVGMAVAVGQGIRQGSERAVALLLRTCSRNATGTAAGSVTLRILECGLGYGSLRLEPQLVPRSETQRLGQRAGRGHGRAAARTPHSRTGAGDRRPP